MILVIITNHSVIVLIGILTFCYINIKRHNFFLFISVIQPIKNSKNKTKMDEFIPFVELETLL